MPSFYEFFAGGGMARAGLGEGWECLLANDIDGKKAASWILPRSAASMATTRVTAKWARSLPINPTPISLTKCGRRSTRRQALTTSSNAEERMDWDHVYYVNDDITVVDGEVLEHNRIKFLVTIVEVAE